MELLILLAIFAVGFLSGQHYGYYHLIGLLRTVAKEKGLDLEQLLGIHEYQEEEKSKILVRKLLVEKHGDTLYLFDKETDEFICQGASVQELAKLALDRQQIKLAAVLHDQKIFQFKSGEAIEVHHA